MLDELNLSLPPTIFVTKTAQAEQIVKIIVWDWSRLKILFDWLSFALTTGIRAADTHTHFRPESDLDQKWTTSGHLVFFTDDLVDQIFHFSVELKNTKSRRQSG